jgi:hypothetical protein
MLGSSGDTEIKQNLSTNKAIKATNSIYDIHGFHEDMASSGSVPEIRIPTYGVN